MSSFDTMFDLMSLNNKCSRETDRNNKTIKKLQESRKPVKEGKWNKTLDTAIAKKLRNAIDEENLRDVLDALKDGYYWIAEQDDYSYDESDVESDIEDFDYIDDNEEAVNYELDKFYDVCDALRIWVPTRFEEACGKKKVSKKDKVVAEDTHGVDTDNIKTYPYKVKEWYHKEYPDDDIWEEIDSDITFFDVYSALRGGYDVYDVLSVGDSVVRERVFNKLSEIGKTDYSIIYNMWLGESKSKRQGKIKEGVNPSKDIDFKEGDIVRYRPEWCSPGERKYLHVVKENRLNPVTDKMTRWLIQTINMEHMTFQPTSEVDDYMIEPTGFNIHDFTGASKDDIVKAVFSAEKTTSVEESKKLSEKVDQEFLAKLNAEKEKKLANVKSLANLSKNELAQLRNDVVMGSLYLSDYENRFDIDTDYVYSTFEGYENYLGELMHDEIPGFDDSQFYDYLDEYDTVDHMDEYFNHMVEWSDEDIQAMTKQARDDIEDWYEDELYMADDGEDSLDESKKRVSKNLKEDIQSNIQVLDASLLSLEDFEDIGPLPERLLKYSKPWWLKSQGNGKEQAAYVKNNGDVHEDGHFVYDKIKVRPVLEIKSSDSSKLKVGNTFEFGGKKFEIISGNLALCLEDIGESAFRDRWEAPDANDYEKSDVKKYIDSWFNKHKGEEIKTEAKQMRGKIKEGVWYAVQRDEEDNDWGLGSYSFAKAKQIAKKNGYKIIAKILDGNDPVCDGVYKLDDAGYWIFEQ